MARLIKLSMMFVVTSIVLLIMKSNPTIILQQNVSSLPTVARVLYLFLCENQNEIDQYANALPSITADVMFFCWKENCVDKKFSILPTIYSNVWKKDKLTNNLVSNLYPSIDRISIKPRVFIINEKQLKLTHRTTWTTARNILYEQALVEERKQGWRWAYFNFADGDVQIDCPLAEKFLRINQTIGDEIVIANQFRSLIQMQQILNKQIRTRQCFILMDTFLLVVSPAIGSIGRMGIRPIFADLLFQIVYHIDAMFNAFHRDALVFILPYCSRYDNRTWWASQAILVYRSLCLYGHAIQFNAINVNRQKHRPYPRRGDPWVVDEDLNLSPVSYNGLKRFVKQSRIVSPLIVQHYSGWSIDLTSNECRTQHTSIDPVSCKMTVSMSK